MSQLLRDQATLLRTSSPAEIAVGQLVKEAGLSEQEARFQVAQHLMEKEAAETLATSAGIDIDQAVAMVKAANINVKELSNFRFEAEAHPEADVLEKAAEYIDILEAELSEKIATVDTLEKVAEETRIEQIQLPAPIIKAAGSGAFTNEDLAELKAMNQELLTKVASTMDDKAWEIGSGVGAQRPKTDPLLEFLLGD